ncbi:MAG: hypothetical protein AAGH82_07605, partial [Pseudomonadota bacterium]
MLGTIDRVPASLPHRPVRPDFGLLDTRSVSRAPEGAWRFDVGIDGGIGGGVEERGPSGRRPTACAEPASPTAGSGAPPRDHSF